VGHLNGRVSRSVGDLEKFIPGSLATILSGVDAYIGIRAHPPQRWVNDASNPDLAIQALRRQMIRWTKVYFLKGQYFPDSIASGSLPSSHLVKRYNSSEFCKRCN
jgi:hypothetical protein